MNNTPVTMNASKSATGHAHNNPSIPNNFERTRIDGTKNNDISLESPEFKLILTERKTLN